MNRFILRLVFLLCALMVVKSSASAAYTAVDSLDFTTKSVGHGSYTDTWTWGSWSVYGASNNNKSWAYLRCGGKKSASTKQCSFTSTASISSSVDKIVIQHKGKSNNSYSVTSVVLETCANSSFKSVSTTTVNSPSVSTSTAGTITITPLSRVAANSYYRIKINWSNGTDSNYGLDVEKVIFYQLSIAVTSVALNKTSTSIGVGSTETLTATVSPNDATNKNITWSTSNADVATVSNGVITAVAEGSATITATSQADGTKTASCTVTVTAATRTAVNMTSFSATETTLVKGNTTTTTVANDQGGWTAAYTYESSDEGVATVDADGVITAVAKGTATITASLNVDPSDEEYMAGTTTSKMLDIMVNNPSHTVTFSVNGNTDRTATVEEGETIIFPSNPSNVSGRVFRGWSTSTIDGTTDTAPSFITEATMGTTPIIYYAVFAVAEDGEVNTTLIITPSTTNFPSTYGTANTFTEYTLEGKKFKIQQMQIQNSKIQCRAGGDENGTGIMYNTDALSKIQSVVLTYDGDTHKNFTLKVGNSQKPTSGTSITPTGSGDVYTYDSSANNYNYFVLTNGDYAGYLASIAITYKIMGKVYSDYCTSIVLPVTVSDASYATFCSTEALDFTDADTRAYIATADGTTGVNFARINKVPANTGVLLYADGGTTEDIPVLVGDADETTGNVFVGTNVDIASLASTSDGYNNYILNKKNGKVGFYQAGGQKVGAGKAYIQIENTIPVKGFIMLPGDDTETGLQGVETKKSEGSQVIYNLVGQRVNKAGNGIYIVNGKKILFK